MGEMWMCDKSCTGYAMHVIGWRDMLCIHYAMHVIGWRARHVQVMPCTGMGGGKRILQGRARTGLGVVHSIVLGWSVQNVGACSCL